VIVFQVVAAPAAGVVPEIVELVQETVPPPLTAKELFELESVTAVLAGSINVADAPPTRPHVATRASAEARPSFLRDFMRKKPFDQGRPVTY
jgi:hypothetical protein